MNGLVGSVKSTLSFQFLGHLTSACIKTLGITVIVFFKPTWHCWERTHRFCFFWKNQKTTREPEEGRRISYKDHWPSSIDDNSITPTSSWRVKTVPITAKRKINELKLFLFQCVFSQKSWVYDVSCPKQGRAILNRLFHFHSMLCFSI